MNWTTVRSPACGRNPRFPAPRGGTTQHAPVRVRRILGLLFVLACWAHPTRASDDPLVRSFREPPGSARPLVWWHWINGNVTRDGITADLQAMARVGMGGGIIFNVDGGAPPGPVRVMTPEWRALVQHAVRESARLGLELGLHNAPGWSASGGTWNTPENGQQEIVTSEVPAAGAVRFDAVLPHPETALRVGYRDIAVLAFPTPAGENVRMSDASPNLTIGGSGAVPSDDKKIVVPIPSPDAPAFIQIEFAQPFRAQSLKLALARGVRSGGGRIEVSDDGKIFRAIDTFALTPSGRAQLASFPATAARFFRVVFTSVSPRPKHLVVTELELSPRRVVDNLAARAFYARAGSRPLVKEFVPTEVVLRDATIDLTARLAPDGRLIWDVPAGEWTILRIGHAPTGQVANQPPSNGPGAPLDIDPLAHAIANRPASLEGAWIECDKLSKSALEAHWAGLMGAVVRDAGALAGRSLRTVVVDSFEIGTQNWTLGFQDEFQRRNGYDLRSLLPVLSGRIVASPEVTERFLWDFRRTIADLFTENYAGHFATIAERHGMRFEIEPYGNSPSDDLQFGGPAHVPLGEFWIEKGIDSVSRLAASVGHTYGRKVIGAEAFTAGSGGGNKWELDPFGMKALGDAAWCAGINRFELHSFVHQPWLDRAPGLTLSAVGTHFDRNVTWFEPGAAWMRYLARGQAVLQQGLSVADFVFFPGEGVPGSMYGANLKLPALPAGFEFDGCSRDVILQRMAVRDGKLVLPDGMSYRALLLANTETITLPLLRKLRQLADGGARIFGPRPVRSPGLAGYPDCDAEVKRLADELWGTGKISASLPLPEVVRALGLKPDFEPVPARAGAKLACIHRTIDGAEVYFVSNQEPAAGEVVCTFRVSGRVPELWHPDTGRIERARNFSERDGRISVPLRFDPAGSVFVVFRPELTPGAAAVGERRVVSTLPIEGSWELLFPPKQGAPDKVSLGRLVSWTKHTDAGVKYFSGTATYAKEFELTAAHLDAGRTLELDLGDLKNLAQVSLNGRDLGVLWKPPFRADISASARVGRNTLEVRVTNLWPNRLIGDEQLAPDCEWLDTRLKAWPPWLLEGKASPTGRLTFSTRRHWTQSDSPLPSGLFGPVVVRSLMADEPQP